MNRILSNLGALLLSLVLAVVVWLIAVQEENPLTTDQLSAVPVTISGLGEGLSIVGQPLSEVSLQLRAQRRIWEQSLRPEDFVVTADLSGLEAGRHNVPLSADYPSSEVSILEIQPDSLVITLESVITRTVPVQVVLLGEPASGYELRNTTVTPSEVTVRGAESLVEQVNAAVVEVGMSGARADVERVQPVILRSVQGDTISKITTIDPRTVEVVVEIAQRPGYRDFSVRVPYTGVPAEGYQITGIVVDPSLVTLRGSPEAFDQLPGYVETVPIDLTDLRGDVDAQLALNLPEALSVVGLPSVGVSIDIRPIIGSRDFQLQPIIRGLGPGLTRTLPIQTVDVVVSGPLPVLNTLQFGVAQVILDLADLGPGVHSVPLTPIVPEGVTVVSLLPAAVDITISAISTVTATVTITGTVPAAAIQPGAPAGTPPAPSP